MWCDVMWCDQQKSCDQSPVSPWVIFFYYNTHLNGPCRINQRHIHGHLPWFVIWIWLLVCLFFIPKTLALSWCKNPKLWNTEIFLCSGLGTRLKVHTTFSVDVLKYSKVTNGWSCIFWPLPFLLVFDLEFTLDMKLCIWALQVI